jgi:hypothetical protein
MSVAPVTDPVHVPPRYPTALIFVDESAAKVSAGRFFVVGAVKTRRPGQLMRAVQDIRDRHDYRDEFKFSKITRARIPVFSELVDVLEQSDAHIAACIVDRTRIADPFGSDEPQWLTHARITSKRCASILVPATGSSSPTLSLARSPTTAVYRPRLPSRRLTRERSQEGWQQHSARRTSMTYAQTA